MSLLLSLIYLAIVVVTGYGTISVVLGSSRRHWAEVAGLSFAGGAGIWGFALFIASLIGISPNRAVLLVIGAASGVLLVILHRRGQLLMVIGPAPCRRKWNAYTILSFLAVFVIFVTAVNITVEAMTPGLGDIDSFAIWMFKAKVAFAQPLRPIPAVFLEPGLSFSHQDYPLGFPLLVDGVYAAIGEVDVQLGKIVLLPIYFSLVGVIYSTLRGRLARADALILTAIWAAAPILRQHAGMAVAEVLLVLMHTCCVMLILQWMESGERRNLMAAGVFAAFAAFTKNEGLALVPIVMGCALLVAIARREGRGAIEVLISAGIALAMLVPWLVYRDFLPHTHEDYGGKLSDVSTLARNFSRLHDVLPPYFSRLSEFNTAGGIWLVLVVAAIVGWRAFGRIPVLGMWLLLLVHLALYALTFMVTPWTLDVLIPMIAAKLLMHVAPTAVLLAGLHVAEFRDCRGQKLQRSGNSAG